MRPTVPLALVVAMSGTACAGQQPECAVSTDCGAGSVCVAGTCEIDKSFTGEGEGVANEGEGEGAILSSEGEGEGEGGEGEGEGAPSVCETFDGSSISVFADVTEPLDESGGALVSIDGVDQLARAHHLTGTTSSMTVQIEATSASFDTVVHVIDDSANTCRVTDSDDNGGSGTNSKLVVDLATTAVTDVVISSADGATGDYTLQTRPLLCGTPTDSFATFTACAGPVASQGCTKNPCVEDDPDGTPSGHFCCVTQSCRTGFGTNGVIAVVFDSNPAGACHP